MFSQVLLVGRVANDPELLEVNGKKMMRIVLAIQRPFKNGDGEYDTDFIPISVWQQIAEVANEVCTKGSVVACKARLVSRFITTKEDANISVVDVVGDRITVIVKK